MQPNPPSTPSQPDAPRPRSSFGPGIVVGVLALVALVYLVDHAGKSEAAVFSDVDRHISEADFHGTQCTAVFGECKIDLRNAQIQGREAVLEAYAIFGDIEIRVPQEWEVVSHGVAVFGSTGDKRRHPPTGQSKTLIVEGAAVFGVVEVKD
jgi:hypothetical protein